MKKKNEAKISSAFAPEKREIIKIGMCVVFFLAVLFLFTGCGTRKEQEKETVAGLDALGSVQVVSREEGSGTRSAFAELLGFDESGEDGTPDKTTKDALIVSDAEAVITAVREDESAIGYISMGLLNELEEEKVLAVNGAAGTTENVKSGNYSLSRPFILAWSGSLSELEQDFLTYVKGKGQGIVEESYVAVAKETTFLSGRQTGTITIHGSTSAAPLLEALAAEYMKYNPNAAVEVVTSDSTTGLNDAMQGLCDFGMASRELKDYEEELLTYETFAQDGIAVIVNGQNPLENVTEEQLKELFTGEITEWEELNDK